MEEEKAHNLYALFSSVDAGARQKRGLGFDTVGQAFKESHRGSETSKLYKRRGTTDGEGSSQAHQVAEKLRKESDQRRRDSDVGTKNVSERHEKDSSHTRYRSRSRERRSERGDRDHDSGRSRRNHRRADSERTYPDRERSKHDSSARYEEKRHRSAHDRATSSIHQQASKSPHRDHHLVRESGHAESGHRSRQQSNNKYQPKKQHEAGEPERLNFEALIPGYERMSAGEKLKARTKLLLARTSKNDTGNREQWTRFMFNKDALLDEEGADDFGGSANAVSLKVPAAQARQEQRMQSAQEAHEAAIFGRPAAVPHEQDHSCLAAVGERAGLGARLPSAEPEHAAQLTAASPIHFEAVQTQNAASWRERAAQLKAQRQAA